MYIVVLMILSFLPMVLSYLDLITVTLSKSLYPYFCQQVIHLYSKQW